MALSGRAEPAGTSISIVPDDALSSPARMRSSVVLPHPDGPTIMKNSPGAMSSETWSTAIKSPNVLVRSRMRIAGRAVATGFSTGRRGTAPGDMPWILPGNVGGDNDGRIGGAPLTLPPVGGEGRA